MPLCLKVQVWRGSAMCDVTLVEIGIWEKVRVPGYAVFRYKDDGVTWLRVAEVFALDLEK